MSRSVCSVSMVGNQMLTVVGILGLCLGTHVAAAADGLQQGDPIGVFHVTKVAGAIDDGVEPGEELCYRCRYGSRPMVMVFARDVGGKVTDLLKEMEAAVSANEEHQLKGLLTLLGEDAGELKAQAEKLATKAAIEKVPVVIAKETKTGPTNYKIDADAAVTVVVANDSQVVSSHTFGVEKIDVVAVMKEVKQMLN